MSFLEETAAEATQSRASCTVAAFLADNSDITTTNLRDAASQFSIAAAHRAMRKRGYQFSDSPLSKHLNGGCSCPTS